MAYLKLISRPFLLLGLILICSSPGFAQLSSPDMMEQLRNNESVSPDQKLQELSTDMLRYSSILPGPQHVGYSTINDGNRSRAESGFLNRIAEQPGYLFLSSALVPGLGQAANQQWWKTAAFAAVEATAIGVFIWKEREGRSGERLYQEYAHDNWSVVQYAEWLVGYNERFTDESFDLRDLANEGYEDEIMEGPRFGNYEKEWDIVNRQRLNELERSTRYYQEDNQNPFSHHLEPYGSQQYYELISKYFQYGGGWKDWNQGLNLELEQSFMSEMWLEHADIGHQFNHDLRVARNMINLLVVNHFVAALDAFFVGKLRNTRLESSFSVDEGPKITLDYRF